MPTSPGEILNPRRLPRRPNARAGFFRKLVKSLGGHRELTDLHDELLQAMAACRTRNPDQARARLKRTISNLKIIERDGSQFVLHDSEWQSILAVGLETLQVAEQADCQPDLLVMIRTVVENLEILGSGKLMRDWSSV